MFIHLMPGFGAVLSMLFLGEALQWYHLAGIGLILCRDLAAQNRGRIWLESVPEQGTRVHVALPRSQDA